MPTATKNAAERTRLANFSLSLTPIIYLFVDISIRRVSCVVLSFFFLCFLCILSQKKLMCVLDTPGDEVFSSFFKIINKILRRLNNREEEEEEEEEER